MFLIFLYSNSATRGKFLNSGDEFLFKEKAFMQQAVAVRLIFKRKENSFERFIKFNGVDFWKFGVRGKNIFGNQFNSFFSGHFIFNTQQLIALWKKSLATGMLL